MGVVLFILASATVAARLLFVHTRTRGLPELFLGLGYLLAGTLGYGVLLAGILMTPHGQAVAEFYQAWSVVIGNTGTFCFYLFVWYVFRRESWLAKLGLVLVALVFVAAIVRDSFLLGQTFGPPPGSATTLAAALGRALVFGWMAIEAFASYFAFRRRARIGLGNPLVANRLFLWGVSAVLTFVLSSVALGLYVTALDAVDATHEQDAAGGFYGALGALASISLWLAFFPPARYGAWLEKGEAAPHG